MNINNKCSKLNKKKRFWGLRKKNLGGKYPNLKKRVLAKAWAKKKGHKFAKKTDILVIRNGVMALCVEGSRA